MNKSVARWRFIRRLSVRALEARVSSTEASYWCERTLADIEAMRGEAAAHVTLQIKTVVASAVVGGMGFALSTLAVHDAQELWTWSNALLLPFLSAWAAAAAAGAALILLYLAGDAGRVLKALQPLERDPDLCGEALAIARSDSEADAYRLKVLNVGRELLRVDLRIMKELQEQHSLEAGRRVQHQLLHDAAKPLHQQP